MNSSRAPFVLAVLSTAALVFAHAQLVRSGNIVTCTVNKGCVLESIDDRQYMVLETPQMVVKMVVTPDKQYNHIDVKFENRSGYKLHVDPSMFRIEVTEPKFKRLSYIEPEHLRLPKAKNLPQPKPSLASSFAATPNAMSSNSHFLTETTLAPADSTSGEVYFERAGNSGTMSVLMPIGGTIYEFPFTPTR